MTLLVNSDVAKSFLRENYSKMWVISDKNVCIVSIGYKNDMKRSQRRFLTYMAHFSAVSYGYSLLEHFFAETDTFQNAHKNAF